MTPDVSSFATACRDALAAVLDALAADGDERRKLLSDAKVAAARAVQEAHSDDQWCLADHLRQGIRDVEVRVREAA